MNPMKYWNFYIDIKTFEFQEEIMKERGKNYSSNLHIKPASVTPGKQEGVGFIFTYLR